MVFTSVKMYKHPNIYVNIRHGNEGDIFEDDLPPIDFNFEHDDKYDNNINESEAMTILKFTANILYLLSRLGSYIKPGKGNKDNFNNKVSELVDLLENLPNEGIFKKNKVYKDILISSYRLKDELTRTFN